MTKYLIDKSVIFDSHAMALCRDNEISQLNANESELLGMLMQGAANKQSVINQIWESKGLFVTDGSYHQLVHSLRVKLNKQGIALKHIRTLPRLGLKFVGDIERIDDTVLTNTAPTKIDGMTAPTTMEVNPATTIVTPKVISATALAVETNDDAVREPQPDHKVSSRFKILSIALYIVCAFWAGALVWMTFAPHEPVFKFRFQQTIDGVHYFSTGRMQQMTLLTAINVTPPKNSFVYDIELGSNNWLAVCPNSIYRTPELCSNYFIEKTK